jgi:hypothetical protein
MKPEAVGEVTVKVTFPAEQRVTLATVGLKGAVVTVTLACERALSQPSEPTLKK